MKETNIKKHIIVETPTHKKPHRSRIEQHYTTIVSIFVGISVVLIACILYFSFTKTVITIAAPVNTVEGSFDIPVSAVSGKIFLTDATAQAQQNNFQGNTQKPGKASGTVTIVNKYSANQTLIATTRLLSTEGVLFRTQETVVVPAGGSVTVPVAADQEGAAGDIPASRFEIVALWDGLKDKIYGTSSAAMTGGMVTQNVVTDNDIATLTLSAKEALAAEAQKAFDQELKERTDLPENVAYSAIGVENVTTTASAKTGDTVSSLIVSATGSGALGAYNKTELVNLISQKITASIPTGYQLASTLNTDDLTTILVIPEGDSSAAYLSVNISYTTTLSTNNELLSTSKLTSLSEEKVRSYLFEQLNIENVTVEFSPFWLKRTPALADHIIVKIK